MADKIIFNDYDVTVEIYDSVIAKWMQTDYSETDASSGAYLKNRDLIQPKLTAGENVQISEDNVISADISPDKMEQFISTDPNNELKIGTDKLLYVGFSGVLRNGGEVATREDLPDASEPFVAHMIVDEDLIVFAYPDEGLGLVWLPLSFYVDMNLYVSKGELSEDLEAYVTKTMLDSTATPESVPVRDSNGSFEAVAGSTGLSVINQNQLSTHNLDDTSHPFILTSLQEIRDEMANKEHFRGYYATTAEVLAIPNPESGDYAYNAETGTKWVYGTAWEDSHAEVPDQMVQPYDSNPLMNGVANPGSANLYARGDHVHQSDTTRVPVARRINGMDLSADRNLTYDNVGASPKVHTNTVVSTYGGGTSSLYGHIKLSDSVTQDSGADTSIGASAKAVKTVNDAVVKEVTDRGTAVTQAVANAKSYTDQEVKKVSDNLSFATVARDLAAGFATFDPALLGNVSAQAVGNSQLLIVFTPVVDIEPADTPYTVFSGAEASILPTLKLRFGQVWDYAKVEQVGFCVFDQDGDLTINAVSTLFAGTSYTLLV